MGRAGAGGWRCCWVVDAMREGCSYCVKPARPSWRLRGAIQRHPADLYVLYIADSAPHVQQRSHGSISVQAETVAHGIYLNTLS